MADEEVIGVAQLKLEAEYEDLEKGLQKVADALQKSEGEFAKFTEKGANAGKRLVAAQEKADAALVELTGSTTAKQLAHIDRRYAQTLEALRKSGGDTTALEEAIAQKKHAILLKEDEDYKRHTEAIAGSNVKLQETLEASSVKFEETEKASDKTTAGFKKTQGAAFKLAEKLGDFPGAAGHVTRSLSDLLTVGLNPVGIATAALAVTVGLLVKKHKEQEEAAKRATGVYKEQTTELQQHKARMDAMREGTNDADERALAMEIDRREKTIALRHEEISNLLISGKGKLSEIRDSREAIKVAEDGLDQMRLRLSIMATERQAAEAKEKQSKDLAEAEETARAREEGRVRWLNQLREETDKQTHAEEEQAAAIDKTTAAHERAAAAVGRRGGGVSSKASGIATGETLPGMGTSPLDRELQAFGERATALFLEMEALGHDTAELDAQLMREREQILLKHQKMQEDSAAVVTQSYEKLEAAAREAAAAMTGSPGAFEHPYFKTHVVGPFEGFGADPFAKQRISQEAFDALRQDAMLKFPEAFGLPRAAAAGGSGPVEINVYNTAGDKVGVVSSARDTTDGKKIDIIIAEDINKGGHVARAIRNMFQTVPRS